MPDMRFAPPNPIRIADRSAGMNAVSVRSYNERLILSLLLQNEGISRMEIGKRTGLSAQTVSVIVRSLEQDGLVAKGAAQKGRMGPPTIALSLNPEGAYSVGISLGHRHTDVVLLNFSGQVKHQTTIANPNPTQVSNQSQLVATVKEALATLPKSDSSRLTGIGLAIPEDTHELALGPQGQAERNEALGSEIEAAVGLEVYVHNDISAAAAGESMFGAAKSLNDYLFFYLGARLHHRLVMNHQIFQSPSQVSSPTGLLELENRMRRQGYSSDDLWDHSATWPDFDPTRSEWISDCVEAVSQSVTQANQFLPVNTVIVSSYAPDEICEEIAAGLSNQIDGIEALSGSLNASPKAIGAASLPFSSKFTVI